MSPTTPTTVYSGPGSLMRKCSPKGVRPGQNRCAALALITATSGRPARSLSVKTRPCSTGMPIAAK